MCDSGKPKGERAEQRNCNRMGGVSKGGETIFSLVQNAYFYFSVGQNLNDTTLICCLLTVPELSQCFGRIFAYFRIPSLKKEIVALLLNRNTEAESFLGGFMGILEHF